MSNTGTTHIKASGCESDLEDLVALLAATAAEGRAFSLSVAGGRWEGTDRLVERAYMTGDDEGYVNLCVDMCEGFECLGFAQDLSARFPALRFDAWATHEIKYPAVAVARFVAGEQTLFGRLENEHVFQCPDGPVCLNRRTPATAEAIEAWGEDRVIGWPRADASGWKTSHDEHRHVLAQDDGHGTHTVVLLDRRGPANRTATVLAGVDGFGGYSYEERLTPPELGIRFPGLSASAVEAAERAAATREDAGPVPF